MIKLGQYLPLTSLTTPRRQDNNGSPFDALHPWQHKQILKQATERKTEDSFKYHSSHHLLSLPVKVVHRPTGWSTIAPIKILPALAAASAGVRCEFHLRDSKSGKRGFEPVMFNPLTGACEKVVGSWRNLYGRRSFLEGSTPRRLLKAPTPTDLLHKTVVDTA